MGSHGTVFDLARMTAVEAGARHGVPSRSKRRTTPYPLLNRGGELVARSCLIGRRLVRMKAGSHGQGIF